MARQFIYQMQGLKKNAPNGKTILDGIWLSFYPGAKIGVIGHNGAGKSTLLRIMAGIDKDIDGDVWIDPDASVGYLPQGSALFGHLRVVDNVAYGLSGPDRRDRAREALSDHGLGHLADRRPRRLSGGEAQRVALVRALVTEPRLILLDEPFSGVDPVAVEELQREIRKLRDEDDIAMLVTDHNVHHILAVCDRVFVIFEGKVFATGTPKQIVNNEQVRQLYLGSTFRGDEFD